MTQVTTTTAGMTTATMTTAGIDTSKATLDIAIHGCAGCRRVANALPGWRALAAELTEAGGGLRFASNPPYALKRSVTCRMRGSGTRPRGGLRFASNPPYKITRAMRYAAHMDCVHFNPVKHGLVTSPADWPYSTFRACVARGLYPVDWIGSGVETVQAGEAGG